MATEDELKVAALEAAARIFHGTAQRHATLESAQSFFEWLIKPHPVSMTIIVGPPSEQGSTPPSMEGRAVAVTLTDSQQVTLTLGETDSKGQPVTGDSVVWTVDNASVVTLTPNGYECLVEAGTVGTATVTVTDGSLTATEAFVVTAGAASALTLTASDPVEQTPAAPAAAPADGTVAAQPAADAPVTTDPAAPTA